MKIRYLALFIALLSQSCFGMDQNEYQPKTHIEKIIQKIANSSLWTKWCNYLLELGKDVDSCESYKANTLDDNPDRINTFDKINIPTIDQHNLTHVSNDVFAMQNNNKKISVRSKKKKKQKIQLDRHEGRAYITFTLGNNAYKADVTEFLDLQEPIITCLNGKRAGKSPTKVMLNNAQCWIEKNKTNIRKALFSNGPIHDEYNDILHRSGNGGIVINENILDHIFEAFGLRVINDKTMPRLYSMIKKLTSKLGLSPHNFFVYNNNFSYGMKTYGNRNAFAYKVPFFQFVAIHETLLTELTTKEVEALLAHECSHVYYEHGTKYLAANLVTGIFYLVIALYFGSNIPYFNITYLKEICIFVFLWKKVNPYLINSLLRYFEKSADLLATLLIDNPKEVLAQLARSLKFRHARKNLDFAESMEKWFISNRTFLQKLKRTHPDYFTRKEYIEKFIAQLDLKQ